MRYCDMIQKRYRRKPMDKPSAPDAVHAFKPMVLTSGRGFPWLQSTKPDPPGTFNGESRYTILKAARPVPKELFPAWIKIKGYKNKTWPEGLPQVMPDFFALNESCFCVSHDARAILDSLAPNAVEYIEVPVETPPGMQRTSAYYYINVLPQAQLLDWDKADLWNWTKSTTWQMLSQNSRNVVFKSMTAADPLIWHEMSLDNDRQQSDHSIILLRGVVWNELIKHFPFQLTDQCLTDPSRN